MTLTSATRLSVQGWWVAALIGLLAAGWQNFPSSKVLALLPWLALMLFARDAVGALTQVARTYRIATVGSLLLAIMILLNGAAHGFDRTGLRHLITALSWIPVAALTSLTLARDWTNTHRIAKSVALAVAVAASVMVVQRVWLHQDRPLGLNHNVHSGTLALIALALVIAMTFGRPERVADQPRRAQPWWLVLAVVATIFVIVLSAARTPLVAFAAVAFLLVALLGHHLRFAALGVLAFTCLLVISLGYARFVDIASEVAAYLAGEHATSIGARIDAWRWFNEHLSANFWFGQSAESVQRSLAERATQWNLGHQQVVVLPHLHNDVLQLLSSYGIVATLAYCATLIGFSIFAVITLLNRRNGKLVAELVVPCAILASVLLVVLAGTTDSLTYYSSTWIAWSSMLGVMLALQMHNRR